MSNSDTEILREITALRDLTVDQLRQRFSALFGEATTTRNKQYLFKRIAYRLQEKKYGGLSPQARQRAAALAVDAPIRRMNLPDPPVAQRAPARRFTPAQRDPRLPPRGTVLKRVHAGREHAVTVVEGGFEYDGALHPSLSAVARAITGTKWNGFAFFGIDKEAA